MIFCFNCKHLCDREMHLCPSCRISINDPKNVRTAQYGGGGSNGTPSPYTPGSSPHSRGMQGGTNFNVVMDAGLDAIMGRTRQNVDAEENPEINFETRLQKFHKYFEEDSIPYELTFKERQEIKEKKNEQRRKQFLESTEMAVQTNTPKYINMHFKPKPEHVTPIEDSLHSVRNNDEERDSIYDDQVVFIDTEGKERIAANRIAQQKIRRRTTFDTYDENDELDYVNQGQMHYFPRGNSGKLTPQFSQSEVEDYLGGDGMDQINGFLEEESLMDYPGADQMTIDSYETAPMGVPSPFAQQTRSNGNQTTERKLQELNYPASPDRQPNDAYQSLNLDEIRGQEGLFTKYPSQSLYLGKTAPTPYM